MTYSTSAIARRIGTFDGERITRPAPLPARSARRFTVAASMISQSGTVSPSPNPLSGSLLLTEMTLQKAPYHHIIIVFWHHGGYSDPHHLMVWRP